MVPNALCTRGVKTKIGHPCVSYTYGSVSMSGALSANTCSAQIVTATAGRDAKSAKTSRTNDPHSKFSR